MTGKCIWRLDGDVLVLRDSNGEDTSRENRENEPEVLIEVPTFGETTAQHGRRIITDGTEVECPTR